MFFLWATSLFIDLTHSRNQSLSSPSSLLCIVLLFTNDFLRLPREVVLLIIKDLLNCSLSLEWRLISTLLLCDTRSGRSTEFYFRDYSIFLCSYPSSSCTRSYEEESLVSKILRCFICSFISLRIILHVFSSSTLLILANSAYCFFSSSRS